MSATLRVRRAGPLTTLQDAGRFGYLRHGISASGPMDRGGFASAAALVGRAGDCGIEFTAAGLCVEVESGTLLAGLEGGQFRLTLNGRPKAWPARLRLKAGDVMDVTPGEAGNYGYLRANHEIDVPLVLGSRATNAVASLGGFGGRALRTGDRLNLVPLPAGRQPAVAVASERFEGPIRFIWGLHADLFDEALRQKFAGSHFTISSRLDRMGARLEDRSGVFTGEPILSLVSEAVVPGDIQILGDGTPIVLMRDHQPTGGYPRIGTVIEVDLDRLAQMRPGSEVSFEPVTLASAHALIRASAS
jgi:biotin-dependent carboxylase-like uncharacterized protein